VSRQPGFAGALIGTLRDSHPANRWGVHDNLTYRVDDTFTPVPHRPLY
jgi:hypothetical protein